MEVCLQGSMNFLSKKIAMVKLAKFILLLIIGLASKAQSNHFVYIENASKQLFNINIDGRIFENDGKSFVIIPKLEIGKHKLLISTKESKDNEFEINITERDLGFILKQNPNGDLVLFDINQFETITKTSVNNINTEAVKQEIDLEKKNISKPKPETSSLPIEPEISKVGNDKPEKLIAKKETPKPTNEIVKFFERENTDGLNQIYIDNGLGKSDTISIFIPYNKLAIDSSIKSQSNVNEITKVEVKPNTSTPVLKDNVCIHMASEYEVSDFSSKIQATLTLKNKLKLAAQVLKEKCFSVNQVKRLGILFLNESGKFNFYKLSQTSVSDIKNFPILEKELKDEFLKQEFRALLNPQ